MFLNTTTHFHINVSWEWTYDGYHNGHKTKTNQNLCGIMYYAIYIQYQVGRKCWVFCSYLYIVTLAHMWLLNNLPSFVKNVVIVKNNTSAIGKTYPSVVLYCFLKYLMECQFFKEIVIFPKSDPFFVLFQTARTLLILTLHWKAMLFWKCLYPYFNVKWLFDVATEVKILLWHTYNQSIKLHFLTTKFCIRHNIGAAIACAKNHNNTIARNGIAMKWNLNQIGTVMEKVLLKWIPGTAFWWHLSVGAQSGCMAAISFKSNLSLTLLLSDVVQHVVVPN